MSSLRALERVRLYEQLVSQLLDYIEVSALRPGDRLPSERELASDLRVSRASLRQATVALEVQGVVEIRHGGGIYLRSLNTEPEHLANLLTRRRVLSEVLEAREALEVMLAGLAAGRRSEADLNAMDLALENMARDVAAGGLGEAQDAQFHDAVTQAAGNRLLADLMAALHDPIEQSRRESLSQPGRPPKSLAGHQRITEAIRRQDIRGSQNAMRQHLRVVADVAVLRLVPDPGPAPVPPGEFSDTRRPQRLRG